MFWLEIDTTTVTFHTSSTQSGSSENTISLRILDNQRNIAIPGYLKLNEETDFQDLKPIGKGGTAQVYVAEVVNVELQKRTGLNEVAIKHTTSGVTDQQFRLELAILG